MNRRPSPDGNSRRQWSVAIPEDSVMTMVPRSLLIVARLGLIAVAVTACATGGSYLTPSGSTTTLMAGWEQHFTLEWTAEPESGGARRVSGYVYNRHGENALNVRLLAQALDPKGAVVGQRIEWVPGGVNGFGRAYFTVPHLPAADTYRVTVWDYTWLQTDDKGR